MLARDKLPVKLPVAVGANCNVKLLDWPAPSVSGSAAPLAVKPLPLIASWETVTPVLPELFTASVCEVLVPISTSPKSTLLGFAPRVPAEGFGVFAEVKPQPVKIIVPKSVVKASAAPIRRPET